MIIVNITTLTNPLHPFLEPSASINVFVDSSSKIYKNVLIYSCSSWFVYDTEQNTVCGQIK